MEAGLPVERVGLPHLGGTDQGEEAATTRLALRFVEEVVLIQSCLEVDLKILHEFIPTVQFHQFVVFPLQILEAAHDLIGKTVIPSRLELQEIRHLDLGAGDLHQETLLIASHEDVIAFRGGHDKSGRIDAGPFTKDG